MTNDKLFTAANRIFSELARDMDLASLTQKVTMDMGPQISALSAIEGAARICLDRWTEINPSHSPTKNPMPDRVREDCKEILFRTNLAIGTLHTIREILSFLTTQSPEEQCPKD